MDDDLKKISPQPDQSRWHLERREVLNTNKWYRFIHDQGTTDKGKNFEYFFIASEWSCLAVALTEDNQLILVRQYRYPINQSSLEVPGGMREAGLTPEELIKKEFLEETGYEAKSCQSIGKFYSAPAICNDLVNIFLLRDCIKVSEQHLEDSELGMEVDLYPVDQVYEMVQDGEITHSLTLAALLLAWPYVL